jgi:PAS domain S-box-containing protein
MSSRDGGVERAAEMRHRAEELARGQGLPSLEHLDSLSPEEIGQTIHELRVHQIELEMQNEELLRTQAELDAVRERYFDLYNLAPVGYLIISLHGLILEVNLTAATMLGLPRAALIGQPISRFIFRADQDIYYRHRTELHVTGRPHACELRIVRNDGTTFWALLTAADAQDPSTNSEQRPDEATVSRVVLSDIDERKRVEEEKAELKAQLQQAKKLYAAGQSRKRSS